MTQPKTLNAFHWHPSDHAHMSCVIADDTAMRTTLYNQWLAARKASPDHTADWPAWRTQHEARQRPAASKRQPGGFATHNGTIPGMGREQQLLAAKPAARAVMSSARHGSAVQFKATRIAHWQQRVFRAALARQHGFAPQCKAVQSMAWQRTSKQRGSGLGNRLFSGPLWSQRNAMHRKSMHRRASHRRARQFKATRIAHWQQWIFRAALVQTKCVARLRNAGQRNARKRFSKQRGSELGNRLFSGPLWSKRKAWQGVALQSIAEHRTESQSNADRSLATGSFPGRFGPNEVRRKVAQRRAAKCKEKIFKATRIAHWQQRVFRAALAHPAGYPQPLYQLIDNGENNMAMRNATVTITGTTALLQNNPQTVDRFNKYAKRMKAITDKKARRTDDDYLEMRDIEIESKIYFDPEVGIYVPSGWLAEAIATAAFRVAKISKANIRGATFVSDEKIKLNYRDSSKVKKPADIVGNPAFRQLLTLPQTGVRVVKAFPIFHGWSFSTGVEFDDKIIDPDSLTRITEHTARYVGFGDFRPKFGRATAEVVHV